LESGDSGISSFFPIEIETTLLLAQHLEMKQQLFDSDDESTSIKTTTTPTPAQPKPAAVVSVVPKALASDDEESGVAPLRPSPAFRKFIPPVQQQPLPPWQMWQQEAAQVPPYSTVPELAHVHEVAPTQQQQSSPQMVFPNPTLPFQAPQNPTAATWQPPTASPPAGMQPLAPLNYAQPPHAGGVKAPDVPVVHTAQQPQPVVSAAPILPPMPAVKPQLPPDIAIAIPAAPPLATGAVINQEQGKDRAEKAVWDEFLQLRKQLDESNARTVSLHGQIAQLQLTHEKEAAAYRDAAQRQIETQRKSLETVTEHYNEAHAKVEQLSGVLSRKAEYIMKCEQQIHSMSVELAAIAQKMTHMEDRVRLADGARQIAEVRQRELELLLEHSTGVVTTLRLQMSAAHDQKIDALQKQHQLFETNRQEIIDYFTRREGKLLQDFNAAIKDNQKVLEFNVKEREEHISKHWRESIESLEKRYQLATLDLNAEREKYDAALRDAKKQLEIDKERWYQVHVREMQQLELRHKEREEHVLVDIARRERELGEREQRSRVQRAQEEQDAKVALLAKEAELKAYYEKIVEDLRRAHDADRERMAQSFRDQLQQLSAQHLNNERELERLHRDKEREMAQRYRVAGYEVDDRKGAVDLQSVTQKTQASLLSKLDSMEDRMRERADQSRSAMRGSSVLKRTSFSNVGVSSDVDGSPLPE
jgi:hypothetical protein